MYIKNLLGSFDEKEKKAIEYFTNNHSGTIKLFENLVLKFSSFYIAIDTLEDSEKNIYYKGYIASITNNFAVGKKLYMQGWHFQLQILFRTQYEQLHNLLGILFDEKYYENVTKIVDKDSIIPITPKQVHISSVVKNIIKDDPKYGNILKDLTTKMKPLYDEFSKAAHGNLMQALLMSSYPIDEDNIIFDMGSIAKPYERTQNYIISMLEYSQIIWFICHRKFIKLGMFELINLDDNYKIHLGETDKIKKPT